MNSRPIQGIKSLLGVIIWLVLNDAAFHVYGWRMYVISACISVIFTLGATPGRTLADGGQETACGK